MLQKLSKRLQQLSCWPNCCQALREAACRAKVLLTATGSMRGKKPILLKGIADEGIAIAAKQGFQVSKLRKNIFPHFTRGVLMHTDHSLNQSCVLAMMKAHLHSSPLLQVETVLVYENETSVKRDDVSFSQDRDVWWQDSVSRQSESCEVEWVEAEDPLFLLYTSGSTGKNWTFAL